MRRFSTYLSIPVGLVVLSLMWATPALVQAQDRPPERQLRSYIPPDQLVSFEPDTPFDRFIELVNPIFERETGKEIIDPEDRSTPIGVSISGMYFFDALELVLRVNDLTYRETERFFVVEPAPQEAQTGVPMQAGAAGEEGDEEPLPANLNSREIQINAILFNINLTRARELGIDWSQFMSSASGGQGGQGGGQGGGNTGGGTSGQNGQNGQGGTQIFVDTEDFFDQFSDIIEGPDQIELGVLARFFRALEDEGAGQTIANPQVTVQSGQQGQIQIGQDVPVQTRDFSGNTVTQFFQTGIIVDVTPTLITEPVADTSGAPLLDFIHLNVRVEDSNSNPSASGPVINRNQANTQVLLLDGEATAIGGLTTQQEQTSRRGIPILKDLPPWFFGLRYIFGRETTNVVERELLIVLQANIVEPLRARAEQPYEDNFLRERREKANKMLEKLGPEAIERVTFPEPRQEEE